MTDPLLSVRDLHVRFDGRVHAVRGASFELNRGEVLGVVGESGSGKSTAMSALVRLLPDNAQISAARAEFDGNALLGLSARRMRQLRGRRIAFIFQDPLSALNPVMSVGRQIAESFIHLGGQPRGTARDQTVALMARVGIPDPERRFDQFPHEFSGGMRQRVMIAIALAGKPELLIADEPTTALDVTVQAEILRLVKSLQAETGMSLIWASHDLSLLAQIADRVMVMYAGQVMEIAPARALYAAPRHPYTRALLETLPLMDAPPGRRATAIPGAPPPLDRPFTGCPFRPRCAMADAACNEAPPMAPTGDGGFAACWRPAGDSR